MTDTENIEICTECELPLAGHCPECQECPRTEGPCWCKATRTQDVEPGMVVEIEGERFAVLGVTVDWPVVRYVTPDRPDGEAVEFGAEVVIVGQVTV